MSSAETGFEVDRALGDGSFSLVNTTAAGVEKYDDTGLAVNTRYRYRVRAIATSGNSLYTAIVTVVTHDCPSAGPFHQELTLPRFADEPESWQVLLNELAQKLEEQWNDQVVNDPVCTICAVNGAIDLDCSRCNSFAVTTGEDINSITVENCPGGPGGGEGGEVELIVTNSGTSPITICGWPLNYGCTIQTQDFPLVECCTTLGPGNSINLGFHCAVDICLTTSSEGVSGGVGGGGVGTGGATGLHIDCEETHANGNFTPTSSATCAKMDCSSGGAQQLDYRGHGGVRPYSWSITTPIEGQPSPVVTTNVTNGTVKITPGGTATDTGFAAYTRFGLNWTNSSGACTVCNNTGHQDYECTGATRGGCGSGTGCAVPLQACTDPGDASTPECKSDSANCNGGTPVCTVTGSGCSELTNGTMYQCDQRNQTQRDSGTCEPCGLNVDSAVLTLTDAIGDSVSITIETVQT